MEEPTTPTVVNKLNYIAFNQNKECFVSCSNRGFRIHHCSSMDKPKPNTQKEFTKGGIGIAEMLFQTNILGVVGGGDQPYASPNRLMLWDARVEAPVHNIDFESPIRAVRMSRERIIVALDSKIIVYSSTMEVKHTFTTNDNSKGIVCLSVTPGTGILAFPSEKLGFVYIHDLVNNKSVEIPAHTGTIACLELNPNGTLLASASEKGTLIRLFDTATGAKLQELRRGSTQANITSIAFSPSSDFVCCASSKGTIHVFSVSQAAASKASQNNGEETKVANVRSSMYMLSSVLPSYFSSEWSFAKWYPSNITPESISHNHYVCSFGPQPHTLQVVGYDGTFRKLGFKPDSQTCEELEVHAFFDSKTSEDNNSTTNNNLLSLSTTSTGSSGSSDNSNTNSDKTEVENDNANNQ